MPSGIERLTNLNRLPIYKVGYDVKLLRNKPKSSAKLSDLKNLNCLRGELCIEINRDVERNMLEEAKEAEMTKKHGLSELKLVFPYLESTTTNDCKHDEDMLEGLKPPKYLKELQIKGCKGQKLPSWARRGELLCSTLPNLIDIQLYECSCEQVPVFSQLRLLKCLEIESLDSVEYMENVVCETSSSKSQGMQTLFFPSLEVLVLRNMRNLKGWWKGVEAIESGNYSENTSSSSLVVAGVGQQYDDHHPLFMQFCKLARLIIRNCPELKSLPRCPTVEDLSLSRTNEGLTVLLKMPTTTTASSSGLGTADMKLKHLDTDNVEHQLEHIPLHQLSSLSVFKDDKVVNAKSLQVFATVSNSLRRLVFCSCDKLKSISQGLEHLTALESLTFERCKELDISGNEEQTSSSGEGDKDARDMMPWSAFRSNLRYLTLYEIPKMIDLPSGLQHLTNLRYLTLIDNKELREIPEWISCLSSLEHLFLSGSPKLRYLPEAFAKLTSLNKLGIISCPGLKERCQGPNGLDYPKIQHIPRLDVSG